MRISTLAIIKKELHRFFTDKRLIFTTIVLPGLMIYFLYMLLGNALSSMNSIEEDYQYRVSIVNFPQALKPLLNTQKDSFQYNFLDEQKIEREKEYIQSKDSDLLVIFPKNFETEISNHLEQFDYDGIPNVKLHYNSTSATSNAAYMNINSMLAAYEASVFDLFHVNLGNTSADLAKKEEIIGGTLASVFPLLVMVMLFNGCMGVATESIAGEKERGTIATLLATPIKRSSIAHGKIIALGIISLASGTSSLIGLIFSLPNIIGVSQDTLFSVEFYGIAEYACLALIILATSLFFVAVISLVSASAKTVKEASTTVMPLMLVVMAIGVTSILSRGSIENPMCYIIPVYNSVQGLAAVFSKNYSSLNISILVISNLFYTCLASLCLTKIFHSEKAMFSR